MTMTVLGILRHLTDVAPWPVWVAGAGEALFAAVAVAVLVRRGRRAAAGIDADADARKARRDNALLVAALAFCSIVLAAFIIGTYEGSTAFAHDQLGWKDWRKVIPWGTLDAAGFGFGLFVIRAVSLERSPVGARRVVYICAGFSALLQMIQGGQNHKWQAGLFLAFVAAIGGLILHTIVDQLRATDQDEAEWHKNPPFGLRWLTYLPNTLCAWLAWINHPPVKGTAPTVGNAIDNLEAVRATKVAARGRRALAQTIPGWTHLVPGSRARYLRAALTVEQAARETDRAEAAEAAREATETLSAQHAEQIEQILSAHAEQVAELAAEQKAASERADLLAMDVNRIRAAAAEQIRNAEQVYREQAEQAIREQVAEQVRQRLEQAREAEQCASRNERTERREATSGQRKSGPAVAQIRGDEQVADDLFATYREQMEKTGQPLSRYRVEQDGRCSIRQANRVLDLMANRYAEQTGQTREQGTNSPRRTDDGDGEQESQPDRELAAANG